MLRAVKAADTDRSGYRTLTLDTASSQRYLGSFRHAQSTEVLGTSVLRLYC